MKGTCYARRVVCRGRVEHRLREYIMVYHSPKSIAKLSYFVVRNMVAGKQDGWTQNRWPGPWYKGLPREPDIRTIKLNSDVRSPLYTSCFDHTYHSATLLMPKPAAHSYKRHKPPNQPYTSARETSPRHHTPPRPPLSPLLHSRRSAAPTAGAW